MSGNIAPLARDWIDAKQEEEYARTRRIEIEKQMIGALEIPAEGSKTTRCDGYKITVTQPVTRKVSPERWAQVSTALPFDLQPIRTKLESDPAGCKYLAEKEPELWAKVAKAFTVTPGKVAFKIEEINDGN